MELFPTFSPFLITFLTLISEGHVHVGKEWEGGPCKYDGLNPDPNDPRVYHLCGWNWTRKQYELNTYTCPGDQVFNVKLGACSFNASPPPKTSQYSCLRQQLERDASKSCLEETLESLEGQFESFLDAAAYRGDGGRNFLLSMRDVNLNMRNNYADLVHHTGYNIFPLLIASENDGEDQGLSGVGGIYKLYFRNGTMRRIVPVGTEYELHKSLSHIVIGVFSILAPYFRSPSSISWEPALKSLQLRLSEAAFALPHAGLEKGEAHHVNAILSIVDTFIATTLQEQAASIHKFRTLSTTLRPLVERSMELAAAAHVSATLPALQQLKAEMGEEEWGSLWVIIPTIWPISLYNVRLQVLRKVMEYKQIKERVLIVEGVKDEEDARRVLGKILADRALAQLLYGGSEDERMKDHLFSISTKRDLLSTVEEEAIEAWCDGRSTTTSGASASTNKCPITRLFSTMLRDGV